MLSPPPPPPTPPPNKYRNAASILNCGSLHRHTCQRGWADLRRATVRLAVVQSFNLPIAAWSWRNSWEQILPRSLTEPVAEKPSGFATTTRRKPRLTTAKAFASSWRSVRGRGAREHFSWPLGGEALRGGAPSSFRALVAYILINI